MRGLVAAGNPDTAAAAVECFDAGGNAIDAAVAAALACFVAEPLLASAGGGGLMVARGGDGRVHELDFFPRTPGLGGVAPADARHFLGIDVDFGAAIQTFHVGRAAATVPTVLPALAQAVERLGRLPLARVAAPAIRLARSGVAVGPSGAEVFALLWEILGQDDATLDCLAGGRSLPTASSRISNPDFADLLDEWSGRGQVPARFDEALLAAFSPQRGGSITAADLRVAAPRWDLAPTADLGDATLFAGRHAGASALRRMSARLIHAVEAGSDDEVAWALALARAGVEADAERRREDAGPPGPGSTTHISTLDAEGLAASITMSNGEGCGFVVPGTGVSMNNFMGEEDLHPRGFFQREPGQPLPTMMAPCLLRDASARWSALGSGGANRIRSAVTRVLLASLAGLPLRDAVAAPRVHGEGRQVWFERAGWGNPDAVETALRSEFDDCFAFDDAAFFFGGVHAVRAPVGSDADAAPAEAVGDARRCGVGMQI